MTSRSDCHLSGYSSGEEDENEEENETYEFRAPPNFRDDLSGNQVREWKEDPRHIAWLQTGCNLSQVLSLIYEISSGVPYYQIRHIIKCGEDEKTQVRRPVEKLLEMGYYDNLERYVSKKATVFEGLPTADSASVDPDGFLKTMKDLGWFESGGRFEGWSRMFVGCCNVDTGLNEPQHLPIPEYSVENIPFAKTCFKARASNWSNKRKCQLCYDSLAEVFRNPERILSKRQRIQSSQLNCERTSSAQFNCRGVFLAVQKAPPDQRKPEWIADLVLGAQRGQTFYKLIDDIKKFCGDDQRTRAFILRLIPGVVGSLEGGNWGEDEDPDLGGPSQARRPFAIDPEIRDLGAVQRRDIETFKDFVQAVLHSKFSLLADYLRYFSDESDDFDIYNLINSIRN